MEKKKQIVFFCATTPYVMIYKIAREFKKRGYETVLITISEREKWDINWYKDGFDKIICSNFQIKKPTMKNSFDMLKRASSLLKSIYQMKKLNPYIVFSIAGPHYIAAMAMKFFKEYPLIYFPYDVYSHMYPDKKSLDSKYSSYETKAEKFCFENADGIFQKGAPEGLDFLKQKTLLGKNLKTTPLKIDFPSYCSDEFMVQINKNKLLKKNKEIHLVNVGGLLDKSQDLEVYKTIFNKLIKQKIHIHLYLKTQHASKKEDSKIFTYGFEPFLNSKYFHLEFSLEPKKLILEISKYDFGIWLDHYGKMSIKKTHLYPSLSTGNKIASFLEAGLPFIYSTEFKFVHQVMKNYQLDFGINKLNDFDNLKIKLSKTKQIEKNIINARKDFNMTNHFLRLEEFIREVVRKKS